MKPKPRNPIQYDITKPEQPIYIPDPKDVPTQLFERALDTMQVIDTLRLRMKNTGQELSPASQEKVQTVEHTVLYMIDLEARAPHPLRDIPEIDDPLSLMIVGKHN